MSRPPDIDAELGSSQIKVVAGERLAEAAAQLLAAALRRAVLDRGAATLMLAGGTTPRATYERLAQLAELPWAQIEVFFGDERAVAPTHPDSNYAMARAALLDHVGVPAARVHRLAADSASLDDAARAYARLLPERLDVLVLGVGEDGHTASLFPRSSALLVQGIGVVPVTAPKPPPTRLSITPDVIRNARYRLLLAAGAGKTEAVARALSGPEDVLACPAQLGRGGVWVLDPAAAAHLAL